MEVRESTTSVEIASTERIFAWVKELTDRGVRTADSDGALSAAAWLEAEMKRMGLRAGIDETQTVDWRVHRHGLVLADGSQVPCTPISHCFTQGETCSFSTGPRGLRAEVVDVGAGSEADFRAVDVSGKIVLADWRFLEGDLAPDALYVHDTAHTLDQKVLRNVYAESTFPDNFYRAMDAGAAGFIGVLVNYYRDRHTLHNEAYDVYDGHPFALPGVWVSASTGEYIRTSMREAPIEATLILEGELVPATSRTVLGYLPGENDDEVMLIESHYDSVTTGAVQDASGVAEVLALADYFSRVPLAERRRTMLFAAFDTHMSDYAAHQNFVSRHVAVDNIVFGVGIEHIGREAVETDDGVVMSDLSVPRFCLVPPVDTLADAAKDAIRRNGLERTIMRSTESAGVPERDGDTALVCDMDYIWRAGVPVVVLIGGPGYLFDDIDTIDKVATGELLPVARALAEVIRCADSLPSGVLEEGRRS